MLEFDYQGGLNEINSDAVRKFVDKILPGLYSYGITEDTLKSKGFTQDEIVELLRRNVILNDKGKFLIHIPAAGRLISSISAGRKAVINRLKKSPRGILDQRQVEQQNIEESMVRTSYILETLIGLGICEVIKGTVPTIRLVFDPYR